MIRKECGIHKSKWITEHDCTFIQFCKKTNNLSEETMNEIIEEHWPDFNDAQMKEKLNYIRKVVLTETIMK